MTTPLHPDIVKAEKVLAKYELLLKGIPVVKVVRVGGTVTAGITLEITAMNSTAADLVRAMLAPEIEGVKVVVGSPGMGALNPAKKGKSG